jgi:protein tyrosine phosphatase
MSSGSNAAVPSWLTASATPTHFASVIRVLSSREEARKRERFLSRLFTHAQLQSYQALSEELPPTYLPHYSVSISTNPSNRCNNRYADIHAYDRTRVILGREGGDAENHAGEQYLNASWVRELFGGKWWIATQAPLPNTSRTFLSMMLTPVTNPLDPSLTPSRIRTVVQLSLNVESGRRKADPYFPGTVGESMVLSSPSPTSSGGDQGLPPPLRITLTDQERIAEAHCVRSIVSVQPLSSKSAPSGPVVFQHLLYDAWPDHGVPSRKDSAALLAFMRLVDRTNKQPINTLDSNTDIDPPIVAGCSAGIGRTGSFIAITSILRRYGLLSGPSQLPASSASVSDHPSLPSAPLGPMPDELKDDLVALEVDSLREQRPGMVERKEQLAFIYEMLISAFRGS